ncbi:hypothetical protein SAMN04488054_14017 [Salibacterium qingdaonense]|uniref:Uncharacterized protein n=2 Tax=Salibacterium qingdaonense TaxID=266892 RepID=A0A1I4QCH1_9BACI|nr:hypothetical protein SAMN04488054_14017 [Salibacterium qingdaonense]
MRRYIGVFVFFLFLSFLVYFLSGSSVTVFSIQLSVVITLLVYIIDLLEEDNKTHDK